MSAPNNVFITGRPGIGKTTALLKAVELLDVKVHGFITREIREGRTRVGFRIEDTEGNRAVMAHVDFSVRTRARPEGAFPRVGKYGVDVGAVEAIGVRALQEALQQRTPVIIDEVGKMELASAAFVETLLEVVASELPVLGTLHMRTDRTTQRIREREDTEIIQITAANRDELPERLAAMLREACHRLR